MRGHCLVAVCFLGLAAPAVFAQRAARLRPAAEPQTASAPSKPAPASEPLRTASDRPIDICNIRLDLRIDLAKKAVDGKATIQFRCIRPTRSLALDAVGFTVKRLSLEQPGESAVAPKHTHDGKKLVIDFGSRWPVGKTGRLLVDYRVQDPKEGLHFFAPGKNAPEIPTIVWSQGETVTNRYWIPCIDEPDQRQTTEIVATVPEGFEAISNGKLVERKENQADKTVTFDWLQDKPHPSYLVTLVVGQFDVVREQWEGIPVLYYVPKGRQAEAAPTYGHTCEMLTFFSERFGIRYPWDKYAQVNAYRFGGGMENTSATTMGDGILVDERTLLDKSADGIVSHELAHQWWGDLVTCRDWSHTWLNEGFASYAEVLWDEHQHGADGYAHNLFQKASGAIRDGKNRPVMDRHYPSPDSMFDGRSYPKGAWVLHMLRHRLGDEAFFKGLTAYANEHKFQSAETMDFRRSMERATGRDLERFFYDWLERAGNPELSVTTEYAPDAQQARITVKQTQVGEAFQFPLKLVVHTSGSAEPTTLEEEMVEKELSLRVPLTGMLTRVDVDPEQAVLAEIKETKSRDLWRAQLLDGPTVPLRLRAVEHFAQGKTDEDRALLAEALGLEKFWAVRVELAKGLSGGGAVCRDALLGALKSSDARIRRACVDSLGKLKGDPKVLATVQGILKAGDPSYAVEGAALEAYAALGQKDAVAVITPWLSRPSHQHVLAASALTALAATRAPAVVETLLTWAQPGHPADCRTAAFRGLTKLAGGKELSDAQRQKILTLFVEALKSEDRFQRLGALLALPELGPLAASALPIVDKIVSEESTLGPGHIHDLAKGAADRIRAQSKPASTAAATELDQLRQEIKLLQREQDELRKRLDKYEKTARSVP
jgi:aminopeptidase N